MRARKRALSWILTVIMVITMLPFSQPTVMADSATATTIYVATNGDDTTGDGTQAKPYKSIAKAKAVVRTLPKTNGDIVVQIADGFYPNDETLAFDKNDSGNANCTIRYEAAPGAKPVISGGNMLDKGVWTEATDLTQTGGLTAYKTTLNRNEKLRAIYVNDKRANMTLSSTIGSANRTTTGTPTVSFDSTNNTWAWQNGSGIRAAIVFGAGSGLTVGTKNPQNIEAESLGGARWARPFVCFASAEAAPTASNKTGGVMLRFQMPYAAISQSLSNNTQYNPGNDQVIRNAFEFFNKRGDFYFDQAESTLYYIPLEGEDINTAEVVIPKLETVVDIRGIPVGDRLNPVEGSDAGRVTNITFDGLTFAHTDYKLYELTGTYTLSDGTGPVTTSSHGFASVQGCIVNKVYFPSSINWHETFYRGYDIPPAAVMINAARNIKVLNGEIGFTGFNGIHLENDVKNCEVTGNYIVDTLSSGVVVGHPQHIYENDEDVTHESSNASIASWAGVDKEKFSAGTEAVPQDIYITNNFLYRNCYGFPGANSLTSFYTTNMNVLHNYLYDSTYGAMSIGWGWCEYDGYGYNGTQTGGPYTATSETSKGRSSAISTTSRNNHINYNRVEEICTVVNDSGAIYSLGRQGDPGNLADGGTWDTVNNLSSSPVTDPTSNWNSDNWTNYTEMNYNFLNPNATNRAQDSNNWTNGFHPDEGSTFIKMNYNVVQSKLSYSPGRSRLFEFNNWKRKSDMTAVGGYVDGDNDQNGGPRITMNNYKSVDRIWPVAGNSIVLNSGLEDKYTKMIPKTLIADTEFELASNVIIGKGEALNRRGLLKAEDTVWLAPKDTTVFTEGSTMTKAVGDAKTIAAPAAAGEYKLYIVYGDGTPTATSKYTAYVDTSATSVNVENGKSYEVSAVQPLKLTLSTDYTYTLNGEAVADGYEISTEGSWTLVLSLPNSTTTTTIKFNTTVSEANKLITANATVAPGATVRFAYDLNDATKKIWISSPSGGHFDGGDDETMTSGDKLGIIAPAVPGTYVIYVLSKDNEVLSQSHARVVVRDTTPVDIPRDGLDLWLKADEGVQTDSSGNVTGWTNMGGVNAKLVPEDVTSSGGDGLGQPSGNPTLKKDVYDYVDFDATSRPLKFAGFKDYNGKAQMTIFTLLSPTNTANSSSDQNGVVYFGLNEANGTWAANDGWSGINLGIGTNRVNLRFGNANGSVQGGGQSISTTISGLTSVRAQLNGSNRDVYVNNNRIGGGTNATALAGNRSDLSIGYSMASATPYRFLGRVAQVLIYDRVLTTDEITKVETYLNEVKAGGGGPANPVVTAVDKTLLNALITNVSNKDLDKEIHTVDSWSTFESALSAAQIAASDSEIGQEAADNSYIALRDAFKALTIKPSGIGTAKYGTPVIGGTELDPLWNTTEALPNIKHLTMANGPTSGTTKVLWDDTSLYVLARVKDPVLNSSNSATYQQDSVEIFVDETNSKKTSYGTGMGQYRVNYLNKQSFNPSSISAGFESYAKVVDGGYYIEAKIPFKTLTPKTDLKIGFDLQINDAGAAGSRQDVIIWNDTTGLSYTNGSKWGVVTLVGKYNVTFSDEGGNGSVSAALDNVQVTSGSSIEFDKNVVFTAVPNEGYRVKEWKVNDVVVAGNTSNTYTLKVAAAAKVTVAFEVMPEDTTAPTWGQGSTLEVTNVTSNGLKLTWPAAQDDTAVTSYKIYKDADLLATVTGSAISYDVTGLTANTTYKFKVEAGDAASNWSTEGLSVSVTTLETPDTTVPTWPAGSSLTASAVGKTAVTLNWTPATDNKAVTGYDIYNGTEKLGRVAGNVNSYEVTGLTAGKMYIFTVKAADQANNVSTNGPSVSVTMLEESDIIAPTWPAGSSLTASAVGKTAVTLNWTPATDNKEVTGYDVYNGTEKLSRVAGNVNSYEVTGLTAGKMYIFTVKAADQANNVSTNGPSVSVTTLEESDIIAPTWPAGSSLTASAIGITAVALNWTPATDNKAVTGYDIYNGTEKLGRVAGNVNSYEVTGLTAGKMYTFAVQAADQANNVSTDGPTVTLTTKEDNDQGDTEAPTWPAGSSITPLEITKTEVILTWPAAQDNTAVTGYAVYNGTEQLATVDGSTTTYKITDLTAGTTYTLTVKAKDGSLNWSAGLNVSFTTQDDEPQDITAPFWQQDSALTVSGISTNGLTLTWTAAQDDTEVTNYNIYKDAALLATVTGLVISYDVTGLASNTSYTFKIVAVDAAGNQSANGLAKSATTLSATSSTVGYIAPTPDTATTTTPVTTPVTTPDNTEVKDGVVTAQPKVTNGVASVEVTKDALDKAFGTSSTAKVVVTAAKDAKEYVQTLPVSSLQSADGKKSIQIVTPVGTAVVPADVLKGQDINQKTLDISLAVSDKNQIGNRPVIDVDIKAGGNSLSISNPLTPVTVSIDYKPATNELSNDEHIVVLSIDSNGKATPVTSGKYDAQTGKVVFTATESGSYAVAFVEKKFEDTYKTKWAEDKIEVLASKGIIGGTSDTTFSPQNSITRADYLTLLMKALGLKSEATVDFDDVKSGDYYYNAVATAKMLGITDGTGNNKFSPSQLISRQDMIVLTEKALTVAKEIAKNGSSMDLEKFNDKSNISSYAIDSVANFVNSGLISGSNGNISPRSNATRAEAAVLIYKIYNK